MPLNITRCEVDKENHISSVFDAIILGMSSEDIELCFSKLILFESHFPQLKIGFAKVKNEELLTQIIMDCHQKGILTFIVDDWQMEKADWLTSNEELFVLSNFVDRQLMDKYKVHYLGFQRHLVSTETLASIESQSHYSASLGMINQNVDYIEPYLRTATNVLVNLDICKATYLDVYNAQPTGIEPETLIQLVRFCTNSSDLKSIILHTGNLAHNNSHERAMTLLAEIIWYVIEGLSIGPAIINDDCLITFCSLKDYDIDLEFAFSQENGKYWVRIYDADANAPFHPCTDLEFEETSQGQLSNRLMKILLHG